MVKGQKSLFKTISDLRASPGLDVCVDDRGKKSRFLEICFPRGFVAIIPRDLSSPGEVLRSEMVLNKLFWPFTIPYDAWMISPIDLKKLFLRLKIGPKVTFSAKTVLQGNFAAIWGYSQTSPHSETTGYSQEMILPPIYSLGKWLSFPGARASMCTHQAH